MEPTKNGRNKIYAREFHVLRDNGTILAFDIENVRLVQLNELELKVLNKVKEKPLSMSELRERIHSHKTGKIADTVAELIRVNMLDYAPFKTISRKEIKDFEKMQFEKSQKKELRQISLNVTHKCNLKCDYCYGEDGSYGGPAIHMSKDTAKQAVDFLIRSSADSDHCRLTFFGGEPLLNFDLVKYVVQYARDEGSKHNKEMYFGMTTNGLILDEKKIDFLLKEKIDMTFSFDGPKFIHDRNRRLRNGKTRSSYDLIYPNILRFIEKAEKRNAFYCFRATITRPGILDIYDLVDFFNSFKTKEIHYDTAEYQNGISPRGLAISEEDLIIYRQKVKEVARDFERGGAKYDSLLSGPLRSIQKQVKRNNVCLTPGSRFVSVSAEGDIYPCHRLVGYKETKVGDVWQGYEREKWLKKYARVHIFNSKVCSRCWIRYFCGGMCPATNYILGHDFVLSETVEPEPVHCRLQKIVFEEAMLLYARVSEKYHQETEENQIEEFNPRFQC